MALEAALAALGGNSGLEASLQIPPAVQAQRNAQAAQIVAREGMPGGGGAIPTSAVVQGSTAGAQMSEGPLAGALRALTDASQPSSQSQQQPAATQDQGMKSLENRVKGFGPALGETALHMASGVGASIIGGWRGLATLASGGTLDDAANAVNEEVQNRTYQPQTKQGAGMVEAAQSPANPMNWVGLLAKKAGETTQDLGGGPGLATAVETGINAAPLVLLRGGLDKPIKPVGGNLSVGEAVKLPSQMGAEAAPAVNLDIPTYMRKQGVKVGPQESAPAQAATSAPMPAAAAKAAPTEAATTLEPKVLPIAEQQARAATLQRIGLNEARGSAIAGDAKTASTDYQLSKLDNSAGTFMRGVLDKERQALESHAERIVSDTGGSIGTDTTSLYNRGNTIIQPLNGLKNWFDDKIKTLYKAADERAQGQPTTLNGFGATLSDDSMLTNSDRVHLRAGLQSYLKKLGVDEQNGNISGTVAQAETVRKYLNENWSPQNSKFVGALKDALDNDVTQAAGEDIYKQARAMRTMRAVTLDDPNGIAKIMDSSGPEGINRAVSVEKIPDTVTGLPVDQLNHILKTLDNMPPELQGQAQAAKAEIKAQIANRLYESGAKRVGQWGARDVEKFLNQNAPKIDALFTPEEVARINDLRQAGHILTKDASYPGAAVQEHNLLRRGAMGAIRGGSAATGAFLGGPVGAAAGDWMGAGLAQKFSEKSALKSAQKRVITLGNMTK